MVMTMAAIKAQDSTLLVFSKMDLNPQYTLWDNTQIRLMGYTSKMMTPIGLPSPKLPPATIADTRLVSMDVKVMQDIEMPNGEIIARRGDVINPLSVSPLLEHYIVINAAIPEQVEWAKTYIANNPAESVVVMLDGAPEPKSPESFYELELALNTQVFLLNDSVESRFHIKKTPSVIRQADDRNIQVSEVSLDD